MVLIYRLALMLTISSKHPDSEDFVDAKMEQGKVTGANISVKIEDDLLLSAVNGTTYTQTYPLDFKDFDNDLTIKNKTVSVTNKNGEKGFYKNIDGKKLWDKIIHNAWKSAEPGVLFWDTLINESVADSYADVGFKTISTNPCGELPLCSHDSCRLVAINLYSYVVNPFTKDAYFDFDLFSEHVGKTQRIMDDIVDLEIEKVEAILAKVESDPESESIKRVEKELWTNILNKAKIGRRTGLGITAEGDMLAGLGLIYGTPEATDFSERVHKVLAVNAYAESIKMAKERGAFGVWDYEKEKDNPFLKRILNELPEDIISMYKEYGRRNIACLTIAPTGSTSLMTQTTSGIEPVFLPVYKRRRKINPNDKNVRIDFIDNEGQSWEEYIVFHHKFSDWMEINGYDTTKNYSQNELNELVEKSPYYKATSNDVDWLEKVRMQGRIQKWVDHSISVTINLPNDVTEELVGNIYLEAWKSGCKGCTIYRDGSRDGVLVSANNKTDEKKRGSDFVRPERLEAKIIHFQNNREKWVAVIGLVDGEPYEIFTGIKDEDDGIMVPKSVTEGNVLKIDNKETGEKRYDLEYVNKKGYKVTVEGLDSKFNEVYWNYAKLISGVLRYGMPVDQVVKLIKGLELDDDTINTWKNGVERAFKGFLPTTEMKGSTCPECGQETIVMTEGCLTCKSCGYSKCDS